MRMVDRSEVQGSPRRLSDNWTTELMLHRQRSLVIGPMRSVPGRRIRIRKLVYRTC